MEFGFDYLGSEFANDIQVPAFCLTHLIAFYIGAREMHREHGTANPRRKPAPLTLQRRHRHDPIRSIQEIGRAHV